MCMGLGHQSLIIILSAEKVDSAPSFQASVNFQLAYLVMILNKEIVYQIAMKIPIGCFVRLLKLIDIFFISLFLDLTKIKGYTQRVEILSVS